MKKRSRSESGLFNTRALIGVFLCLIGTSLGWLSLAASPREILQKRVADRRVVAPNSNPTGGLLNPTGPNVTWAGTSVGGASLDESTCTSNPLTGVEVNCDTFTLTLNGSPSDWSGKLAHIVISWPNANDDYDVFVHKGAVDGPIAGSSAQGGAGPEVVDLDPNNPVVGTGTFTVHVVYFSVPAPAVTGQYMGTASAVNGGTPAPTPTPPGATPTPTPTPAPSGPGVPRYQNYYPPTGVADDAGEPSLGINWNTEETHTNNRASDGAVNPPIPNGGTSNYYGGFLTYMLRARFDDCASPAIVDFQQKTVTLPAAPRAAGDPILFTDHETGRTFVSQLLGLTPAGSTMEFTDNDGDTFTPSEGGAPSGVDHQTVGGGPFHAPIPALPTGYPNAVFYASQSIADATSQTSVDGGITFPAQSPLYTVAQCGGLHGHVKVSPDGTAFIPNKGCVTPGGGVPLLDGGAVSVVVSEDSGITWNVRSIPNEISTGNDDPSVGVSICRPNDPSCDKATRSNTIYLGYQAQTPSGAHAKIAVSHDKGLTWQNITDVGALPGGPVINNMAFPEVVVGDPDRAAFAFFGTPTAGNNSDQPEFTGNWYLYVATTYDGGVTWNVINATPNDPIQRNSGICGDGTCRNLLDFFDIQVDKEGRILIGGEDGCIGGCVNGGTNSFTAKAFITRQSGGRRLFANFDPVEPAIPGAPLVSATVSGSTAHITWLEPDSGGATITSYRVFKNASFVPIATVTQRSYDDPTYVTGDVYRVTAVNAQGESAFCHNITPSGAVVATACVLPGILVSNDLTQLGTDDDTGQNTPLDPRVNARQLFIAEPFVGGGVENLVFTLQVAPSTTNAAPASSQWIMLWNRQDRSASDIGTFDRLYLAMVSDAAGSLQFEYGKFGVPIDTSGTTVPTPEANAPTKFGDADSGSYDPLTGIIRITISKSKLRAIDGGASKYVPATDLAATNVRTYFNRPDYNSDPNSAVRSQRSQNNASDITADGTYTIVGNASCSPLPQLVSAVSRKTHGTVGDFDVKLAPIVPATATAIECRVGQGANANQHKIVFTFAAPVTFTGASVSSLTGGTPTVVSNSSTTTLSSEVTVVIAANNAQRVTVSLLGVTAGGASATVSVDMGLLLGDITSDGRTDAGDVNEARQFSVSIPDVTNFRNDVNVTGRTDAGDVTLTRQSSVTNLP